MVCGARVFNVVKLQMRVGSAQRQQAMTSVICPTCDSCSGESHFQSVRRFFAWFPLVQRVNLPWRRSLRLKERSEKVMEQLLLLDLGVSFCSVAKRSRRNDGHHNFARLEEGLRIMCLSFLRTSIPPATSTSFQMRGASLKSLVPQ